MKDLEAAYCGSSAFKDVFQYLRYNKLPSNRNLSEKVRTTAQDYYVIGSILFKYIILKTGELDSVMCIPPSKMDNILDKGPLDPTHRDDREQGPNSPVSE